MNNNPLNVRNSFTIERPTSNLRWYEERGVRTLQQLIEIQGIDQAGKRYQTEEWRELPVVVVQRSEIF